ncbi:MAG: DUF4091 domain-containing protein, partial [Clostridia bacterium]|nr:DUF4091 domain-containing protein [Clostridia bacterium]
VNDAILWGAPSTEKILQDVHGVYDDVKTDAVINVDSAKGEKESQHIIITAKDKKLEYTLELSDLQSTSGAKFKKENIEVFHEKYLSLTTDFDKTGNPLGGYPDAIVPYENIVMVGENYVEPNKNQGLLFRFDVPVEQEAGVYTGSAKITIGRESKNIPITLNVRNLVVSQVNHAKTHYLTAWYYERGELDTTQEMLEKYNDFLYEYRLCGSELIDDTAHTTEEVKEYVDMAYEKMQNPMCSVVSIPGKPAADVGFDGEVLKKYLRAFVKKSFETNYNMMDKLVFYENYVDEPQYWGPGGVGATQTMSDRYRNCIKQVAQEFERDKSITSPIKDEVIASLKKVPNVITAWYENNYAPHIDTWCPTINHYYTEFSRSLYADQEDKWWYWCIDPRVPYPTLHIEDTLLSARLEAWMRANYGVEGCLNWAADVFAEWTGETYVDIEDYYTGSASRFPKVNGDGWIMYPGKAYGVDGPIASLRMEAMRDGNEEYELYYEINETYKRTSDEISEIDPTQAFNSDKIMQAITSSLYVGTRVTANSNYFKSARSALYDLATLCQNAGVCIADFKDNSFGQYVFTLVAPKGTVIKQNGTITTPKTSIGNYDKYELIVNLTEKENFLKLTAEKDGVTCEYSQSLGGKASANKADNVNVKDFGKDGVTPTCQIVDANTVDATLTGKMVKVDLPETRKGKEQSFTIKGSLLNGIGANGAKLVFHVYYNGEDNTQFVISAKYKNMMIYYDIATTNLHKGMNAIEINLTDKDWSIFGGVEYLTIYVGGRDGESARTVYFVDSIIYEK